MIRVLLVGLSPKFQEFLINKFISIGINVSAQNKPNEVVDTVNNKEITHIILNIDNLSTNYLQFIESIKQNVKGHFTYIIVQSRGYDKKTIHNLLKKSVIGFLSTSADMDYLFLRLQQILNSTGYYPNRRNFFRVWASEEDNLRISFPVAKYNGIINGSIRVIGLSGIAFKLNKENEIGLINKGDYLDKVQITLNENRTVTKIRIIKPGLITGAEFVESMVNENFTNFLCNFIFKKLSISEDDVTLLHGGG